jgi:hypothetical protein
LVRLWFWFWGREPIILTPTPPDANIVFSWLIERFDVLVLIGYSVDEFLIRDNDVFNFIVID